MSQPDPPPTQTTWLQTVLESVKDMAPPLRFGIVFAALLLFFFLSNATLPDSFLPLIYFLAIGITLLYLVWEWQQFNFRKTFHKLDLDDKEDVRDHKLETLKAKQKHEKEMKEIDDRDKARKHQERLAKLNPTTPPPPEKKSDPAALETQYLAWVQQKTGKIFLSGIDRKAITSEANAHLDLQAVYTALLTYSPDERMLQQERTLFGRSPSPVSALEQANRHPKLVLLGAPGSGKSTFVNFLALCLAGERLENEHLNLALLTRPLPKEDGQDEDTPQTWEHGYLLPIVVILRDLAATHLPPPTQTATASHLWNFIAAQLQSVENLADFLPYLQQTFKQGKAILLLDGLDEVSEADKRRVQIRQMVENIALSNPKGRILITSRTYAYQKQEWRLNTFADSELAPFSQGQMIRFIYNWYRHVGSLRGWESGDIQGRADLLQRAIFNSPDRLLELAKRPLLLTLMASLHAWRGSSLPEKREELYAATVELLLDLWESQRVKREGDKLIITQPSLAEWLKVDKIRVRNLLEDLAFAAHAKQPTLQGTADIPRKELLDGLIDLTPNPTQVNVGLLMDYLSERSGLLVEHGTAVYTFPHRTFQEYLAACHLTRQSNFAHKLAKMTCIDPDRWREVCLLAGARAGNNMTDSIWLLTKALCSPPWQGSPTTANAWGAHLAGQLLVENLEIIQDSRPDYAEDETRVKAWLAGLLGCAALPGRERAVAGQSLGVLGDDRPEVMTVAGMRFCRVPAGPFWMGQTGDENAPLHLNNSLDYDYWLGLYPVSNAQFAEFVAAGGYTERAYWPEAAKENFWQKGRFKGLWDNEWRTGPINYGRPFNLPNHPVVGLTWYEALAFTRWLAHLWKNLLPPGYAVVLPSEAEWEKAARGGVGRVGSIQYSVLSGQWSVISEQSPLHPVTPSFPENPLPQRVHPWGDTFEGEAANGAHTALNSPSTPGCFPLGASPFSCQEMAGNVWEWTRSHYQGYTYDPTDGREDLTAGRDTLRVLRGGAYYSEENNLRCAHRNWNSPSGRNDNYGLRVGLSPFTSGR